MTVGSAKLVTLLISALNFGILKVILNCNHMYHINQKQLKILYIYIYIYIYIYLNPYNKAFANALILQKIVGKSPKIGERKLMPKNISEKPLAAYGVQAINHTKRIVHVILASFTSNII